MAMGDHKKPHAIGSKDRVNYRWSSGFSFANVLIVQISICRISSLSALRND
jgi:hypothetical protein